MAQVRRVGANEKLIESDGKPTPVFFGFLRQISLVITAFADLDGNADDISDGDINRFREIADLVVTRDPDGRIETLAKNGKTTSITRDVDKKITVLAETVDADPAKVTTQIVSRDSSARIEGIEVVLTGYL